MYDLLYHFFVIISRVRPPSAVPALALRTPAAVHRRHAHSRFLRRSVSHSSMLAAVICRPRSTSGGRRRQALTLCQPRPRHPPKRQLILATSAPRPPLTRGVLCRESMIYSLMTTTIMVRLTTELAWRSLGRCVGSMTSCASSLRCTRPASTSPPQWMQSQQR